MSKELDFEAFLESPKASDYLSESPLRVLVEWFLEDRRSMNLQPATIKFYRSRLAYLCKSLGDRKVSEISTAHLKAVIAHLKETLSWGAQNTNHQVRVIKTFFNYLENEEIIEVNPARRIKKLRQPSKFPIPFNEEEISAILGAIGSDFNGVRDRIILLTLLDTGVRLGELMGLRADDLDIASGQIRVLGKGSKERFACFGPTLGKHLMKYLAIRQVVLKRTHSNNGALWVTKLGTALREDTLQSQLRFYGRRSGIEHVHAHRLRHTFAYQYLVNGGSLEMLQRLLGHTTPLMTLHYAHLANLDAQANHAVASPLEKWKDSITRAKDRRGA